MTCFISFNHHNNAMNSPAEPHSICKKHWEVDNFITQVRFVFSLQNLYLVHHRSSVAADELLSYEIIRIKETPSLLFS